MAIRFQVSKVENILSALAPAGYSHWQAS